MYHKDIDECASGIDRCDKNAACFNTFGSYTCHCLPGFVGNGTNCGEFSREHNTMTSLIIQVVRKMYAQSTPS